MFSCISAENAHLEESSGSEDESQQQTSLDNAANNGSTGTASKVNHNFFFTVQVFPVVV